MMLIPPTTTLIQTLKIRWELLVGSRAGESTSSAMHHPVSFDDTLVFAPNINIDAHVFLHEKRATY